MRVERGEFVFANHGRPLPLSLKFRDRLIYANGLPERPFYLTEGSPEIEAVLQSVARRLGAVDIQVSQTKVATKAIKEAKRWASFS